MRMLNWWDFLPSQVNYRARYDPDPVINVISWRGESDTGVIIGLDPYSWYTVDVQVRNTAGLGPRSELYHAKTFRAGTYKFQIYLSFMIEEWYMVEKNG